MEKGQGDAGTRGQKDKSEQRFPVFRTLEERLIDLLQFVSPSPHLPHPRVRASERLPISPLPTSQNKVKTLVE